jgi:hypothetical protein
MSIIVLANAKAFAHPTLKNLIQRKFERATVEIPFIEGTKLKYNMDLTQVKRELANNRIHDH